MNKLIPIEVKIKIVVTSYKLSSCNYEKNTEIFFVLYLNWRYQILNKIRELGVWYVLINFINLFIIIGDLLIFKICYNIVIKS